MASAEMNLSLIFISTILCVLYSLGCLGLGIGALRILGLSLIATSKISSILRLSIAFLLGAGSITIIWTILLSLSIFKLELISGFLMLCLISAIVFGRQFAYGAKSDLKNIWQNFVDETLFWKIAIILTLFVILQRGLACLMPLHPMGDAAAFYMVLPKLLAYKEKLVSLGGYGRAMTIGLHGELHFAALMSLGSDWIAKLFTWPISLACAFVLAGVGSLSNAGRRGQWLAISMVFTSTAFTLLIGDGKVDLFGAAMGVAAFYWALLIGTEIAGLPQIVTGMFTGFAIVAKISYGPSITICITLLILWRHFVAVGEKFWNADNLKGLAIKCLWFILGISLPVIIHLIKNWVLIGEPFAPFYFIKGNPFYGNWTNQTWFSPKVIKKIILTYPLALTYGKYPMQYGTMSTMVLAFTPLVLLLPKPKIVLKSSMLQITILGLVGIIVWVLICPGIFAPRYILYTLLLLIPLAAGCGEYVSKNETEPRWFVGLIVGTCIISLIININYFRFYNSELANYLVGRSDESKIVGPVYRASEKLNNTAEIGAKIFSLTYFTFWFRPDLLQYLPTRNQRDFFQHKRDITSEEGWAHIYKQGFRYVFLNQSLFGASDAILDPENTPDTLEVEGLFDEADHKIYRISAKYQKLK